MVQPLRFILFCALLFIYKTQQAQFKNTVGPKTIFTYNFNGSGKIHKDQPSVYVNMKTRMLHAVFTGFDNYKSGNKKDSSGVYYAQSPDFGKTWGKATGISKFNGDCSDGDSTVKGPVCCIDASGAICVTWIGPKGLLFQRSVDNGETWLPEEKVINPVKNGWACMVDGIATNGLPKIACDQSNGTFKGRLYICWSDEKYGVKNKDVFLVYSDDNGQSWTEPILVTYHPNHKEQFYPHLALDNRNGDVYIGYYDKQNYTGGKQADIYMAKSSNGGLKFEYYKINENPVDLTASLFLPDAFNLAVNGGVVKISWTVAGKKDTLVYSAIINDSAYAAYNENVKMKYESLSIQKTFVFAEKMDIHFALAKNTVVSVVITKPLDPDFEKIVVKNKKYLKGNNSILIDAKLLGLKKGNYTLFLYYDSVNKFSWITEE